MSSPLSACTLPGTIYVLNGQPFDNPPADNGVAVELHWRSESGEFVAGPMSIPEGVSGIQLAQLMRLTAEVIGDLTRAYAAAHELTSSFSQVDGLVLTHIPDLEDHRHPPFGSGLRVAAAVQEFLESHLDSRIASPLLSSGRAHPYAWMSPQADANVFGTPFLVPEIAHEAKVRVEYRLGFVGENPFEEIFPRPDTPDEARRIVCDADTDYLCAAALLTDQYAYQAAVDAHDQRRAESEAMRDFRKRDSLNLSQVSKAVDVARDAVRRQWQAHPGLENIMRSGGPLNFADEEAPLRSGDRYLHVAVRVYPVTWRSTGMVEMGLDATDPKLFHQITGEFCVELDEVLRASGAGRALLVEHRGVREVWVTRNPDLFQTHLGAFDLPGAAICDPLA